MLKNQENACTYCRFAVEAGCVPIAPHIYFTQFMNDNDRKERDLALFMDIVLLSKCAELWVFGEKITSGMSIEIDRRKKKKIKLTIWRILQFLANPRFLLCFGLAWLITNGWCYILFGIGTCFEIGWMTAVAGAYLAFLWLPISPEKIVTVALAMGLLRLLFPNDRSSPPPRRPSRRIPPPRCRACG